MTREQLIRDYGSTAVAYAERCHAACETQVCDGSIVRPLRGDGHGLNFVVTTAVGDYRVIVTSV